MAKKFSYAEHIKKHTMKENTYNEDCEYCNPEIRTREMYYNIETGMRRFG